MVRLIVDDAGNRRAFNVGEGRLTLGSGNEAKLKLGAHGIASLHAEIEIQGGKATLHPKPGVTPPMVLGRTVTGPVMLQHGVPVKIGGATVTVEYEGQASQAGAAGVVPGSSSAARSARRKRDEDENDDQRSRARRQGKQGVPTWVWIVIGIPLLGGGGWLIMNKALSGGSERIGAASAQAYYQNASLRVKNAQYSQALEQLDRIPAGAELDPALDAQVKQLRQDIEQKILESAEDSRNSIAGKQYFDSQLKGFVDRYMSGQITAPEARVFLKRARTFRQKWPTHPEMAWVDRQESRFKGAVDLSKPPTLEDIKFEVESLTWSYPRNYREAFAVVHAFQATAQGADVQSAIGFQAEVEAKRAEWYKDRLEQARFHFDRKEEGKSIGVLLSIIRYAGDDSMENEAARQLMLFGDMQTWLRGYRTNDPDGFAEISGNHVIAAFLKENPI